ncbi:hypothetical protein N0V87_009282 [Didymella glomerata]|uniref:Uncharacterized protein n=1 Tax=Didymella glomerata TaxID=749621 RepID=A0A9W8WRF4_9PLEO|nr:hypothetical protein N0V87_009282 [Didymella glomerata]
MKAAFCSGLEEIWPHDVNGEPLFNLDKSTHGERILMSSDRLQRIWPEPELKVLLYLEDGAAPKPLKVDQLVVKLKVGQMDDESDEEEVDHRVRKPGKRQKLA